MPITTKNILAHEWIGLEVTVQDSPDPRLRGVTGRIRDETKNTLAIQNGQRTVRVAKAQATFTVRLPTDESLTIEGELLRHRPEDRIKKGLTKW